MNLRRDVLHKLTTQIVRRTANVGIEHPAGVLDRDGMSRAIAAMGFYEFRRQLDYKAAEAGVEIAVTDREFPSSRLCGACGEPNRIPEKQWRRVQRWTCECCGTELDRDLNAAFNLDPGSLDTGAGGPELPVQ